MALSPKSMHLFMKSKIFLRLDLKVDPFTDLNKRVRVSSRFQNKQNKKQKFPKKSHNVSITLFPQRICVVFLSRV